MLIHALAAACFAFYSVNVVRLHYRLKFNRKPLNCVACLSAWSGLLLGLLLSYGWQSLEVMFLAGVMGLVLDSFMKRYL